MTVCWQAGPAGKVVEVDSEDGKSEAGNQLGWDLGTWPSVANHVL